MTIKMNPYRELIDSLSDKLYREIFVEEHIKGLAFQMKTIRTSKGLSQGELGRRIGIKQEAISRLESHKNNGNYLLSTLMKVAKALDVGLTIRFVPFSELIDIETKMPTMKKMKSFEEEDWGRYDEDDWRKDR